MRLSFRPISGKDLAKVVVAEHLTAAQKRAREARAAKAAEAAKAEAEAKEVEKVW